jgi:DNA-binding transcriptional regulator YbjK
MPRLNPERRDALADAAIGIVARNGVHGLSHRTVDEKAGVPNGTASNYFRSRDALLQAAGERVIQQHRAWIMAQVTMNPEPSRAQVIDNLAAVLDQSVTVYRDRMVAMFELAMESTRRPALAEVFARLSGEEMQFMRTAHEGADLGPADVDVAMLNAFYNGMLFVALVIPGVLAGRSPGDVTRALLESVLRR